MPTDLIKEGKVQCDRCKKLLAKIICSHETFAVLEEELRYTQIRCLDCTAYESSIQRQIFDEINTVIDEGVK